MMSHSRRSRVVLSAAVILTAAVTSVARSDITSTGNVEPSNPATWTLSTFPLIGDSAAGSVTVDNGSCLLSNAFALGYLSGSAGTVNIVGPGSAWIINGDNANVGFNGDGTINVVNGATVSSGFICLGYQPGTLGTITVDGQGSQWNNSNSFVLGYKGSGVLNITDQALVTVASTVTAGSSNSASGAINFGSNGGTLTCQSLFAAPSQISGTGTIDAQSLVTDGILNFDVSHGLRQSLNWASAGQNVLVNLDLTSGAGTLGVGYQGSGTMTLKQGTSVTTGLAYLGYKVGSTGFATISGNGASWVNNGDLYVGYSGAGSLSISNEGAVGGISTTYLGYNSGSSGTMVVDGSASGLTCSKLIVGFFGNGTLSLSNGGQVVVAGPTYVANAGASAGAIVFVSGGGTFTTQSLYASPSQFSGTGVINTNGAVTDGALFFDASHGLTQSFAWTGPNQNIAINLNMSGTPGTIGNLGAGYQGSGTLTIQQGARVTSSNGYIGYKYGSAGSATVSGAGSTWTTGVLNVGIAGGGLLNVVNGGLVQSTSTTLGAGSSSTATVVVSGASSGLATSGSICLGYFGSGTLNIGNGASVNCSSYAYIGYFYNSTGAANVSGAGSLWTIGSDLHLGTNGSGALNITNGGKVICPNSNSNVFLGETAYSSGSISIDGVGSVLIVNGGLQVGSGDFGGPGDPGYPGPNAMGEVTVTRGGKVSTNAGGFNTYIGFSKYSAGTVTVDGLGSTWSDGSYLYVGYGGHGLLNITNGGSFSDTTGALGYMTGATGVVIVDGHGSTWTNTAGLGIVAGTLSISNAGLVTAPSAGLFNQALLNITVGDGSQLNLGTGYFGSSGAIRFEVAPAATAGTYTPIIAGGWGLNGTLQTVGGIWNGSTHKVTVTQAATGVPGTPVGVNLYQTQRVVISDPSSPGNSAEVAFQSTTSTSNISFVAATLTDAQTALLSTGLSSGTTILSGWTFNASGYSSTVPILLSLDVGPDQLLSNLQVWHFDGSTWISYNAPDLTYDGSYANFTVTGFSGYAVTAAPEPATAAFLLLSGLALLHRRRANRGDR